MSKKEIIITVVIAVLAIALIATVIVAKKMDNVNNPTTPSSGVAHDHDGDGVADHDDSAHATQGTTAGGNSDGVVPEDGDVDVSIDLEDLPGNSGGTTEPTTGNNSTTEPTTGNDPTEPTTGNDSTEPTTGNTSGAVSGNEIDMDDLINAGRN